MYHSGDDLAVVNAARVSFDKESEWEIETHMELSQDPEDHSYYEWDVKSLSERDKKLISYLAKHNHWTPFAHNSITLRMQAPIPIRTQCFKHKFGFVENEESRRYICNDVEVYIPDEIRAAPSNGAKQGSDGKHKYSDQLKDYIRYVLQDSIQAYENLIAADVCPEQARFVLPQGAEVNWIWTGSLAAYARFASQRTDPHAQHEVRLLAEEVSEIMEYIFPVSWEALMKKG